MSEIHAVILVPSTSYAIQIERLLQKLGIPCRLIPVPRYLSSDCGLCVRILESDTDSVLEAITGAGIEYEGLHEI